MVWKWFRYLQQLVRIQADRNRELEAQLAHYTPDGASSSSHNADSPSVLLSGVNGMMMNGSGSSADPLSMLHSMQGIGGEDDNVSMMLSHMSPDDTSMIGANMAGGGASSGGLARIGEDADVDDQDQLLKIKTSPRSVGVGSEEEEERGRGAFRGRRGYGANGGVGGATSVSVGKAGVRDDSAGLDSALSDGESRERMMDE